MPKPLPPTVRLPLLTFPIGLAAGVGEPDGGVRPSTLDETANRCVAALRLTLWDMRR